MRHITAEYGTRTNLLECTTEEYDIIKAFLLRIGVECRMVSEWNGSCTFQARNAYRDNCVVFPSMTGRAIADRSERDIADRLWTR